MKIVDATNCIYGKLSAAVAKELLETDEEIVIVNAANVIITGSREFVLEKFLKRRDIGSVRKGPYYPRLPRAILKRSIGDMLPKKKSTGKECLKRVMVYNGCPEEFREKEKIRYEKTVSERFSGYVTLKEVSKALGKEVKIIE
ncbi:50S ribosomal protein L13 [Caldiplasma sukawensis]